jgi:hypothetical protein
MVMILGSWSLKLLGVVVVAVLILSMVLQLMLSVRLLVGVG